jgi:hypothetical protein
MSQECKKALKKDWTLGWGWGGVVTSVFYRTQPDHWVELLSTPTTFWGMAPLPQYYFQSSHILNFDKNERHVFQPTNHFPAHGTITEWLWFLKAPMYMDIPFSFAVPMLNFLMDLRWLRGSVWPWIAANKTPSHHITSYYTANLLYIN